jgi:epoxyqueuosine reductase
MSGPTPVVGHDGRVPRPAVSPAPTARPTPSIDELRSVGEAAGLAAVGVARAEPFTEARDVLEARRTEGLADTMAFTYRNPARSTAPQDLLRNARSLVVGAVGYHRSQPARPTGVGPLGGVARYAWEDHYGALRTGLEAVATRLRAEGHRAAIFIDSNHLVDREAAFRAGLGWYGKNTNLLLSGRGSWFVLGSIVTDADLPADAPQDDGCGPCRHCLDACPTGALPRPGVLDARRCLAWLAQRPGLFPRQYRVALGDRVYGCDDCQTVCPPNRRHEQAVQLRTVRTARPDPGPWVPLLELLDADDDTILDRWGRWYLYDRRPFALRRNALIALGNVADPDDPAVGERLVRRLADPDPLLRATAVWAARRLGRTDLLGGMADDPDPAVREELVAAVERR